MEKFGIDNFIIVLDSVASSATAVDKILEDKKVNLEDLQHIFPVLSSIGNLKTAFPHLKEEFSDMSEEERTRVKDHFKTKFDLRNDEVEEFIENAFAVALSISALIKMLAAIRARKESSSN